MTSSLQQGWDDVDGVEVTEYLLARGWTAIQTSLTDEGFLVEATGPGDLEADLAAFTPTVPRGQYMPPVPDVVRQAASIVRQVAYATDADLGAMTAAQQRLALRALARALLWVNARLDEP